jgi:hypothetical protein
MLLAQIIPSGITAGAVYALVALGFVLIYKGTHVCFCRNYSDLRRCRQWSFRAGWLDCNWSPGKQLVTPQF